MNVPSACKTLRSTLKKVVSCFVPKTLFGQLMLVFMGGLLFLQFLGVLHALYLREYYLLRGAMGDRARIMSSTVLLLNMAEPQARISLLENYRIQGFEATLLPEKPALPMVEENEHATKLFITTLNRALNTANPLERNIFRPGRNNNPEATKGRKDDFQEEKEYYRDSWDEDVDVDAPNLAVSVLSIKLPGAWDMLLPSSSSKRDLMAEYPQTYHAQVAIRLEDGSWVAFDDTAPRYTLPSQLPLTAFISALLVSTLLSIIAVYRIVRPLRRLAQAADTFGHDIHDTPDLPETGPREVREAAQAFNRMQSRIRQFVDERSRTLAALSHDLRTPLTRLRLRVEQLAPETRPAFQKDMDELQQLTDASIDLARGYSSSESLAPVDMASLLESMMEDRRDMGHDVSIVDEARLLAAPPLLARPLSLKRCLNNLLDNAIRYGNKARLDIEDSPTCLAVLISDTGPGIPEEYLEKVFDPFFRLEPSRNRSTGGCGLGLATARSMARQHGGDIVLANQTQGGLLVRVTFKRKHE